MSSKIIWNNLNKNEIFNKAIEKHKDKFLYLGIVSSQKITNKSLLNIRCCKCNNIFTISIAKHITCGHGCAHCAGTFKKTKEKFVLQSNIIHYYKYNYNLFVYINCDTKGIIICPIHGQFLQTPQKHINRGDGCPKCSIYKKSTKESFVLKSNIRFNFIFNYDQFNYIDCNTKGTIVCKIHGCFEQTPTTHLNCKYGCPACANNQKLDYEKFVNKSNVMFNYIFNYDKFVYIDRYTHGIITCVEHGDFLQSPKNHLKKAGCPKCGGNVRMTYLEFIEKSNALHNNKYDYKKSIIFNTLTKTIIICPIHGEFKQSPAKHIYSKQGCPKCAKTISKPEIKWLNSLNIKECNRQISLPNLPKRYKVDGFDPETNTIYEFHGDYWHGNPKVFNCNDINKTVKKTFKELYDKTIERENKIKKAGYNLIVIWEADFNMS